MDVVMKATLLLGLLAAGIQDWKEQQVSVWILWGETALLLAEGFWTKAFSWDMTLSGIAVGAFLMLVSALSGGKIGLADGWVFCWSGLVLGGLKNLCLLFASLLLAGMSGAVLEWRRKKRHLEIPFSPFVALCFLGGWIFG